MSPPEATPPGRLAAAERWALRLRPLGVLIALALVLLLGARFVRHPESGDTRFYRLGADLFWSGGPLYFHPPPPDDPAPSYRANTGYTYLPPFAAASGWMRWLPYSQVRLVWLALSALFLGAACSLAWRHASRATRAPPAPALAFVLLIAVIARFVVNDLAHGQVNALVCALLSAGLLGLSRGRDGTAGVALGLALVIKPTSWLLLPWLALERRWRGLGAALGTLALTSASAALLYRGDVIAEHVEWLRVVGRLASESLSPSNGALSAQLAQVASREAPLAAIAPARVVATLVALGLLAFTYLRARATPERARAAVLVLAALASPVTWKAHLVVLLIPGAIVVRDLHPERPRRALATAALAALLILPSKGVAGLSALERWGATPLALLLLYGLLLLPALESGPPEAPEPSAGEEAPAGA